MQQYVPVFEMIEKGPYLAEVDGAEKEDYEYDVHYAGYGKAELSGQEAREKHNNYTGRTLQQHEYVFAFRPFSFRCPAPRYHYYPYYDVDDRKHKRAEYDESQDL